jgi:acetate kinase
MALVTPRNSSDLILAINSGSSSLKFGLFTSESADDSAIFSGSAEGIAAANGNLSIRDANNNVVLDETTALPSPSHALRQILVALQKCAPQSPSAIGHRIVHGGPRLRTHQRITKDVLAQLEAAVHFAPLHIPAALALIRETERLLPRAQQFACFDTAFHSTMPESASRFALPNELFNKGIYRYGFHGLSYESIVHRLGANIPARVVCAHLGSGSSLCALRDGRSVDTSMGLTPTGGVPMATRSGDLDPGVLLFLMRNEHLNAAELEDLLNHHAGLIALAGDSDMRTLESRAQSADSSAARDSAALAIEIFSTAVRKYIGAYAATLGGLDRIIFTGGIGEHSAYIRSKICAGLDFLGVRPTAPGEFSNVSAMPAHEELQIARHCRQLMLA